MCVTTPTDAALGWLYVWRGWCGKKQIRRFPGQMELGLTANVELASTTLEKKAWSRPPVNLEFQVPMFTASGLRVRFLKVWEKAGYNTVKWVRYVTRAGPSLGGSYDIRCS